MNIREVEELTGLVRANIRYYEQEGFFTPERERNGYRNYTEEDIKILKRIKLLRMLEVPIEEIRRVQSDEVLMRTVLEQSIRRAEEKKKELTEAQQICKKMTEDRVTWNTLEADRYLNQLERVEVEEESKKVFVYDSVPSEPYNLRRYAARWLDFELYVLLIYAVYYLILSPEVNLWNDRLDDLLGLTPEKMDGGFSGQVAGLEINYRIQNEGYHVNGINRFFGWDGDKHRLTIVFSMKYALSSPTNN